MKKTDLSVARKSNEKRVKETLSKVKRDYRATTLIATTKKNKDLSDH